MARRSEADRAAEPASERLRVDKWLWYARVVRTRSAAARLVEDGSVRANGQRLKAASHPVKVGDVLTVALERTVLVYQVRALGERRGGAPDARQLYEDLSPGARPADPEA